MFNIEPMHAVLTGDVVNSRAATASPWLRDLKKALSYYGASPQDWEIFRGDSFQLIVPAQKAFEAALYIKACIKQQALYDVRQGIGIGNRDFHAPRITESNGTAFVHSGAAFENLGKNYLAILTPDPALNQALEVMTELAGLTIDNWTPITSEVIRLKLENPDKNQMELARVLKKSQSSVSDSLSRGGFSQVMKLNTFFKKSMQAL